MFNSSVFEKKKHFHALNSHSIVKEGTELMYNKWSIIPSF